MSVLSMILKEEHATLLDLLYKVQGLDIQSSEGGEQFEIAKFMLLEHLKNHFEFSAIL